MWLLMFNACNSQCGEESTDWKKERVLESIRMKSKQFHWKKKKWKHVQRCTTKKYTGAGTHKLYNSICKRFAGVSKRDVASVVNTMHKAQRLKPTIMNKAPVMSSSLMNQVQIDMVDITSKKVTLDSETYRYILVILDVFSCFLLQSTMSSSISRRVKKL